GTLGLSGAFLHAGYRFLDQVLDFLGGLGTTLSEVAHFGRHHGKTATRFAGARRFDGGIKREDIGLEGNRFDQGNDIADLQRAFLYAAHGLNDGIHDFSATPGDLHAVVGELIRELRIVRVLPHRDSQLLHTGGRFLQRGRLIFSARGQVAVVDAQGFGGLRRGGGAGQYIVRNANQTAAHHLNIEVQLAGLAGFLRIDGNAQVAG